jgi:hypothetical protein
VKRIAVAMLGFGWGLLWTWLTLYVLSRVSWTHENLSASDCADMEHCSSRLIALLSLAAVFLVPASAFASLNAIAYRRWSVRRWATLFFAASLLVFLFYLFGYART